MTTRARYAALTVRTWDICNEKRLLCAPTSANVDSDLRWPSPWLHITVI